MSMREPITVVSRGRGVSDLDIDQLAEEAEEGYEIGILQRRIASLFRRSTPTPDGPAPLKADGVWQAELWKHVLKTKTWRRRWRTQRIRGSVRG
jgi:hypothetical protein